MKPIPFCLFFSLILGVITFAEQQSALSQPTYILHIDGKPLARYRFGDVPFKPYIDELRTPSGKNILRDAPNDHLHHHGLMFAIEVGDCGFWEEKGSKIGKQLTLQCRSEGGTVTSIINWDTLEPRTLLKEVREITGLHGENVTLLDWKSTLTAVVETKLGGKYYYGLGMRFLQEMDKDGRFFDDTGKHDGEIIRRDERLTRCRWMAYTAKLNGEFVTVALFDHPSNPIQMTAFTMGDAGSAFAYMSATMNLQQVPVELKSGESFAVKYRIAIWDGEATAETIEKTYGDFIR